MTTLLSLRLSVRVPPFLCLLLPGKLLLDLGGDDVGIHFVCTGRIAENTGGIRPCSSKHDGGFRPSRTFIGAAKETCNAKSRRAGPTFGLPLVGTHSVMMTGALREKFPNLASHIGAYV
jgi:hypothetical protein